MWTQRGDSQSDKTCQAIDKLGREEEEDSKRNPKISAWLSVANEQNELAKLRRAKEQELEEQLKRRPQKELDDFLPRIHQELTWEMLQKLERRDVIRVRRQMDKNWHLINEFCRRVPYHIVQNFEEQLRKELEQQQGEDDSRV